MQSRDISLSTSADRALTLPVIGSLLVTGTLINYVLRQAFSIMAPAAEAAIPLSTAQASRLFEAFLLFYSCTPLMWGYLLDLMGVRRVYGSVALVWCLLQTGYVFARSFSQLLVLQILLGTMESVNFVACTKTVAVWCLPPQRARLSGFVQAAAVFGAMIAPPICALAIHFGGWRSIFAWNSMAALLWVIAWFVIYRDPEQTRNITWATEPNGNLSGSAVERPKRLVVALFLARLLADPLWWFYLLWLPTYLVQKHISTAENVGRFLWIPYGAASLGALAGGTASDRLIRATGTAIRSRLKVMVCAVTIMPVGLLILRVKTLPSILAVLSVLFAGHMAWKTNLDALTSDSFPRRFVGRVASLFSLGSGLGGVTFFACIDTVVRNFSYAPIFLVLAFVHPAAFLTIWAILRNEKSYAVGSKACRM
jgi:MFS transporter, ACS family, hexuronate transporter